jgi:hypothetical protein
MSTQTTQFEETTKVDDTTEYLWGPEPIFETMSRNGTEINVVVGMASIQRQDVVDFKSKAPTGEKLVWLVIQPNQGRAQKMRFKFASQALDTYNAFIAAQERADAGEAPADADVSGTGDTE